MASDNEIIRHNMARLINAFASLAEGNSCHWWLDIIISLCINIAST